jgi:hypothetical protein
MLHREPPVPVSHISHEPAQAKRAAAPNGAFTESTVTSRQSPVSATTHGAVDARNPGDIHSAILSGTRVIAGAGHYVFLPRCPPAMAADSPPLCVDPPGIDRAHVHDLLAADAVAFFNRALASSLR